MVQAGLVSLMVTNESLPGDYFILQMCNTCLNPGADYPIGRYSDPFHIDCLSTMNEMLAFTPKETILLSFTWAFISFT